MQDLVKLIEEFNQLFREVRHEVECLRTLYAVIRDILEENSENSNEE